MKISFLDDYHDALMVNTSRNPLIEPVQGAITHRQSRGMSQGET